MKVFIPLLAFITLPTSHLLGFEEEKHQQRSAKIATAQDELGADLQELIEEQTNEAVISFLEESEEIVAEAASALTDSDTSGKTIAAQTEVIEKIYEAAKSKQQEQQKQNGKGKPSPSSAMMEMMERMMGKQNDEQQKSTPSGGDGSSGNSSAPNTTDPSEVTSDATTKKRKIPSQSGITGKSLPSEFQDLIQAYNRKPSE